MSATPRQRFVVDSSLALDAGIPEDLFSPTKDAAIYESALAFVANAILSGAELHAPHLFFSEVANVVNRELVGTGKITRAGGLKVLRAVLSTRIRARRPKWPHVYEIQERLRRTHSCADSEFLAVARFLGCEVVTTDEVLVRAARQHKLDVPVVFVVDHPLGSFEKTLDLNLGNSG